MLNALFIVWRECFEALLVVGILYSFLKRQENFAVFSRYLVAGVFGGIILSGFIAYAIQHAESELEGAALEYFETGMLVVAALLMTQMCIWMKKHARFIKGELEQSLSQALGKSQLLGISLVALLAVAREGAEIVVFFYGMGLESKNGGWMNLALVALLGLGLAVVTFVAFTKGIKAFNPKWFFRITTIFLFLTASTMLLSAVRKLVSSGTLPTLMDQTWDTSLVLDERTPLGSFVTTATGYQSTPPLIIVLVWAAYWIISMSLYFRTGEKSTAA